MSEKSAMNVDLRDVQEKVEDGVQSAKNMSRKVVLASIGVWGLAYDKAQEMWDASMGLVDKAEKRGEEIEQDFGKRFNKMQEQVQEQPQVKKVVDVVDDGYDNVSKNAKSVVAEVEKFLGQFQAKTEEVAKDVAIEVEKVDGRRAAWLRRDGRQGHRRQAARHAQGSADRDSRVRGQGQEPRDGSA